HVAVAVLANAPVLREVVRVDHRAGQDVLTNVAAKGYTLDVGDHAGYDVTAPLNGTEDGSLVGVARTRPSTWSSSHTLAAANVGLVDLNWRRAAELLIVFCEESANAVEHPPRRFVSDAKLALKLLRGDPAAGLAH